MNFQQKLPGEGTDEKKFNLSEQAFLILSIASFLYVVFKLIPIDILVASLLCIISFGMYLKVKLSKVLIKDKGLINSLGEVTRKILTEKSIMDIYRDVIYFPKFLKLISAFVKGAISRPPPEKIHEYFQQLPQSVQQAINTKGILRLFPKSIQNFFFQARQNQQKNNQIIENLPPNYGKVDFTWQNQKKYHEKDVKIHQHTLQKKLYDSISSKVKWRHIAGITGILIALLMKTKAKKMGKIFLYNSAFVGTLIAGMLVLIKISKPLPKYRIQE